jgi:hypothetical protein
MNIITRSSMSVLETPGKGHDTGDLSQTLRRVLRDAIEQDPDLEVTIEERAHGMRANESQKGVVGKVQPPVETRLSKGPEIKNSVRGSTDAEPETHDRAYFALLKKVAVLEKENQNLRDQLDRVQVDATQTVEMYVEVAREVEDKYLAEKASNQELQDRLQRVEASSLEAKARLASAEETIKMLQANERVQVCAANERVQACAVHAYNSLGVVQLTAPSISGSATCSATGEVEVFAALNASCQHMQQEAVEYRRAVRDQLRSAAATSKISTLSCSALERVLCTPLEMLDGEVLSEDEEEEEVCTARRRKWGRSHIIWSHEA